MKKRFWATILFAFMAEALFALSIGEREIKMFKNEVVKCAKDVFSYDGEESGNVYTIKIKKQTIRDILIDSATIKCYELSKNSLKEFIYGDVTYENLRKNVSFAVRLTANENALQDYINIAIKRVPQAKRIFDDVTIKLKNGKAILAGKLYMKNVNLPSFMSSNETWAFEAELGVKIQGQQIYVEIYKAVFDGSTYPMLLSALLSWLNPVWDFGALSEKASIDMLEIKNGKIEAFGRLFR